MRRKLVYLVLVAAVILGTFRFIQESGRIRAFSVNSWVEDQRADCAVVLTGGANRVHEGFDLLAQRNIRKLIISGVNPSSSLRQIFPQWPFYGKLDPNDVILEKRARTTFGNAQQTLPIVEALHCRDLILITSRTHMYRAQRIFKGVFPNSFPIYSRAVLSSNVDLSTTEILLETTKSLFYSIWAY